MQQPLGFVHPDFPHHVYKLKKSIYGLKQAPLAWFSKLSSKLLSLGFVASVSNFSLFTLNLILSVFMCQFMQMISLSLHLNPHLSQISSLHFAPLFLSKILVRYTTFLAFKYLNPTLIFSCPNVNIVQISYFGLICIIQNLCLLPWLPNVNSLHQMVLI